MMNTIPQEAINKAQAAGWKPNPDIVKDYAKDTPNNLSILFDAVSILDPAFWQALGKSLGWKLCDDYRMHKVPVVAGCIANEWYQNANRFYSLILDGTDTAAFWQEILK